MSKVNHEVRDPVHGFIRFDHSFKHLIDSSPFQRLRNIHQLAMQYQVYPGACHKRFEHSIGVMHVADRIYDSVLSKDRLSDDVHDIFADNLTPKGHMISREVLRVGALLHDVGHLPFSHAAEELLPDHWNHERLSVEIIRSNYIRDILEKFQLRPGVEDIVNVIWDPSKRQKFEKLSGNDFQLSTWDRTINSIITDDTFGADRIDYLLRDALHAGVPYGRFDYELLINGLSLVVEPGTENVRLAFEVETLQAAEALLLARYFMYTQVYFHKTTQSYNIHLKEFLQAWLPNSLFPNDIDSFLRITDNEVLSAIRTAALDPHNELHTLARRLFCREHFRTAYSLLRTHAIARPTIMDEMVEYATANFGQENVRVFRKSFGAKPTMFWVVTKQGDVFPSSDVSDIAQQARIPEIGLIFIHPDLKDIAKKAISGHLRNLLASNTVNLSVDIKAIPGL